MHAYMHNQLMQNAQQLCIQSQPATYIAMYNIASQIASCTKFCMPLAIHMYGQLYMITSCIVIHVSTSALVLKSEAAIVGSAIQPWHALVSNVSKVQLELVSFHLFHNELSILKDHHFYRSSTRWPIKISHVDMNILSIAVS